VISLAVAAAGSVGVSSPGDYAALEFPPTPRHDLLPENRTVTEATESLKNLPLSV